MVIDRNGWFVAIGAAASVGVLEIFVGAGALVGATGAQALKMNTNSTTKEKCFMLPPNILKSYHNWGVMGR
jgi:hypothetical protein